MSPTPRLVTTSAFAAVLLTGLHAQTTFEVASVKPNTSTVTTMKFPFPSGGRFNGTNLSLRTLISFAYNVQGFNIGSAPSWFNSDRYDIAAKAAETNVSLEQYRQMLQTLLAERFHLATHRETRDVPIYTLTSVRNGKLEESRPGSCAEPGAAATPGQPAPIVCGSFFTGPVSLDVRKTPMPQIAGTLSIILGRPVIDQTGFTGTYDFHIEFAPEGVELTPGRPPGLNAAVAAPDDTRPSIFTALQQQLGLKLESQKGPSEVLVIDHVERIPAGN